MPSPLRTRQLIRDELRLGNQDFYRFFDDFDGEAYDAERWKVTDVGGATEALAADVASGAFQLALDATSEAQDAVLDWGDNRAIDLKKKAYFEFRARCTVLPTTGVTLVMGLAGDHNLDKDTITESAWFRLQANASLLLETDDTTNNNDDKDTGLDLTVNTWYTFAIDCRDGLADVKFLVNNGRKTAGTTFDMSNLSDSEAIMQPYFSLDKATGTGVGTLQIDYALAVTERS